MVEIDRDVAFACCIPSNIMYAGNEFLQCLARNGRIEYQSFMGYASDIGAPMTLTACALIATAKMGKTAQRMAAVAIPLMLSCDEFGQRLSPSATVRFDPYDILCYFIGSLLAY